MFRAPYVVECDDVRMGEARGDVRLQQQPLLAQRTAAGDAHGLERDRPSELRVARLPDHAEAAAADLAHELEASDGGTLPERLVPGRAALYLGCSGQVL